MSAVLPEGIDHLADCPYTLHQAILFALRVLQYEEFPIDERPPKHLWLDTEKLDDWWEGVERKRKAKYSGKGEQPEPEDEGEASVNAVSLLSDG